MKKEYKVWNRQNGEYEHAVIYFEDYFVLRLQRHKLDSRDENIFVNYRGDGYSQYYTCDIHLEASITNVGLIKGFLSFVNKMNKLDVKGIDYLDVIESKLKMLGYKRVY